MTDDNKDADEPRTAVRRKRDAVPCVAMGQDYQDAVGQSGQESNVMLGYACSPIVESRGR